MQCPQKGRCGSENWTADVASKQALCNIPNNGKMLFGKSLEEAIKRVTGEKSGLLSQTPRKRQQPFLSGQFDSRGGREARSYRPGQEYTRPQWRGTQSSFLCKVKSTAGQATKETEIFLTVNPSKPSKLEPGWQDTGESGQRM